MTPEQKAREVIDRKLLQSGWLIQDVKQLNLMAGLGVAVRGFPTSTGPVDYALFVDGVPVGVVEAKKDNTGAVHFAEEKMEWLRMVKDYIAGSLSITPEDLEPNPFDCKGRLKRFYAVFGDQYEAVLQEMNIELVA